jgi:hypothetical protein
MRARSSGRCTTIATGLQLDAWQTRRDFVQAVFRRHLVPPPGVIHFPVAVGGGGADLSKS